MCISKVILYYQIQIEEMLKNVANNVDMSGLKGTCLTFLSAIYQLFIKYFNIK